MRCQLLFPDEKSSELVLQSHPDLQMADIEFNVEDVPETYEALSAKTEINWIRKPIPTETSHAAVLEAPDSNVFVLVVGK
ncbi:glyoxalase [Paenibacillus melissococcoides]|uniref:Glyoxalase n=1 Tax=Paenibacillus melissococcoides TaxID=2912268 RepID=A0ABM9FUT4_9BACL|nr:glyoxalase [Bacillus cereus]CAH8242902.1 glyoxalase [Paenibacillus melissococcoides]CAH8703361.1 glyoxalase [Paenibacillus melissococcoides]CAH8706201.1 glyoxalase [Paenibacillus melissococcoides]